MKYKIVAATILLAVILLSACGVDTTDAPSSTIIAVDSDGVSATLARWKKANQSCWIQQWEQTLKGIRIVYRCE